ncbi:AraC family transcriptional regulator [Burkholderia cepacia]|uniref:AraC family transcriptional regulator n=1 Tax=Burkholderia cepacia TaxID=292 RepID=UPI001CF3FC8B|nr:AraC family transcriptional regulator [Burkholderia cepacia]MCA8350723.1 AraC family transcriptional regulator [Burkholderia cepacia]
MMAPDLEAVDVRRNESFSILSYDYPYRMARGHFHIEFELHLIINTGGILFVGDHIGSFGPGNLVLMGPNLPHKWVSDIADGEVVKRSSLVIHFSQEFVKCCMDAFPEFRNVQELFDDARCGVLFDQEATAEIRPMFEQLLKARGIQRIVLFLGILARLVTAGRSLLASRPYTFTRADAAPMRLSHALAYIGKNLSSTLREADLAKMTGQSVSAFSRAFRRHIGTSFVRYVNHLRIESACQMLLAGKETITSICFEIGFNNVSNFNRQFRTIKGMSPSQFRALHRTLSTCVHPEHPRRSESNSVHSILDGGHQPVEVLVRPKHVGMFTLCND